MTQDTLNDLLVRTQFIHIRRDATPEAMPAMNQGEPDMFHATIHTSTSDPVHVKDKIPFKVTYRFRGESTDIWVSQVFQLAVDSCPSP